MPKTLNLNGGEPEGDEGDDEVLQCSQKEDDRHLIIYDITRSPSYQVPVLYVTFKLSTAGRTSSVPSLDAVYDLLVPPSQKAQLQATGVMGALSMTDHPITGTTAYFIHPCRTSEAMQAVSGDKNVKPEEYLLLWLGLVGPSVGLTLPIAFAEEIRRKALEIG